MIVVAGCLTGWLAGWWFDTVGLLLKVLDCLLKSDAMTARSEVQQASSVDASTQQQRKGAYHSIPGMYDRGRGERRGLRVGT